MLTSVILRLSVPHPQQLCRGSTAPDPPTPHQHHPRVFVLRAGSRLEDKTGLTEKRPPIRPTRTKGYLGRTGTRAQ
ncbi:hypothetical protein PBY51_001882 [Eleginops maclovinus]|uniref:Uncharacterized protein n=1 Tax=Eleginops maclovinus TaxID=56733 RepID=A0AAN7WX88_ELEMC|nr:hypothetical protein PBY51_001882 [Eleginops maclovinus]